MTGDSPSIIQVEVAHLRADNTRLRKFVESIVDANGPYPELNGTQVVRDAYAALATEVPQQVRDSDLTLADDKRIREWGADRSPRFFRETSTGMEWHWNGSKMTTDGEDSIFRDPADILECLDVIETDRCGNPLVNPLA